MSSEGLVGVSPEIRERAGMSTANLSPLCSVQFLSNEEFFCNCVCVCVLLCFVSSFGAVYKVIYVHCKKKKKKIGSHSYQEDNVPR